MKKTIIYTILFLILSGVVATVIFNKYFQENDSDAMTSETPIPINIRVAKATNIAVSPVELSDLTESITLPGSLIASEEVILSSELPGKIEWIGPEEGDIVNKGDEIIKLNTDTLKIQKKQAEIALEGAKSSLEQAGIASEQAKNRFELAKSVLELSKTNFDRMQKLFKEDNVSQQTLDQAQERLDNASSNYEAAKSGVDASTIGEQQAKTGVASAEMTLENANLLIEKSIIYSPITGVLNKLQIEKGEYTAPGLPLANVVQINPIKVKLDIPEKDIAFISTDSKMDIYVDAFVKSGRNKSANDNSESQFPKIGKGGFARNAPVTYCSVKADSDSRTYATEVTLDNSDLFLKPGMIIKATFKRRHVENTIAIPLSAIIPKNGQYYVYVEENGRAIRKQVHLGIREFDPERAIAGTLGKKLKLIHEYLFATYGGEKTIVFGMADPTQSFIVGTRIQIKKGLEIGDKLIVSGQHDLDEYDLVKIIETRDMNNDN